MACTSTFLKVAKSSTFDNTDDALYKSTFFIKLCARNGTMCIFVDLLLYRKRQRQTREEMTNMNVLNDTTWLHATRPENVYEAPLPNTEGYDNTPDVASPRDDIDKHHSSFA